MKYVTDSNAAKSLSAWLILKKGKLVAKVHAHFGNSTVTVNVFDYEAKDSESIFQRGTAGGYGYDKLTAALKGMTIAGHKLSDHCGESKKMPKGGFKAAKAPKGWHFANSSAFDKDGNRLFNRDFNKDLGDYYAATSCYRAPGLEYLEKMGFQVMQAI